MDGFSDGQKSTKSKGNVKSKSQAAQILTDTYQPQRVADEEMDLEPGGTAHWALH